MCPRCGSSDLAPQPCSGKGDVYSYTVVPEPGAGGDPPPVSTVALVHLVEGAYVTALLTGIEASAIFIGMPVELAGDRERLTFRPRRSLVE